MIKEKFPSKTPLEYRWTRKDGYWRMTKGFVQANKEIPLHYLAEAIKEKRDRLKAKGKKIIKRSKKVINHYMGD